MESELRFSLLHVSDLHRDPADEVSNAALIQSIIRDIERATTESPAIPRPSICIVTGDLVFGARGAAHTLGPELDRQFDQATQLLASIADECFRGDRERIVLLPGNHDVCYDSVMDSIERIDVPIGDAQRKALVKELRQPGSALRWSWDDMCFFRIVDRIKYDDRLLRFKTLYESFYKSQRTYSLAPNAQHDVFDFPDVGLSIMALSSCYDNDPFHRAGAFHPESISTICRLAQRPQRAGWLIAAAWHHNVTGSPQHDDYLDIQILQLLIDSGVSLGFHGHQHRTDCIDERYRLGEPRRKISLISAGTLCGGPRSLPVGSTRSYNIIELNTDIWAGRVHQRAMVNQLLTLPIWGPGHLTESGRSFIDFELCKPVASRPTSLDVHTRLDVAECLVGSGNGSGAISILTALKDEPLARPLLLRAISQMNDAKVTIELLWPPLTAAEAVVLGDAILLSGTLEQATAFLDLSIVSASDDASVREVCARIGRRYTK